MVAVPRTPGGKESWPQYAAACRKELDRLATQVEVSGWVNRNFPTYHGKAIEAGIDRHVRETRQRMDEGKRQQQPAGDQQQPAADREAITADDYLKEIAAMPSVAAGSVFGQRGDVVAKMARWERERPELHQMVTEAAAAKMRELKGPQP